VDRVSYPLRNSPSYTLRWPNWEIRKDGLYLLSKNLKNLLGRLKVPDGDVFKNAVRNRDARRITTILGSLFGGLAARHHRDDESFYHSMLYAFLFKVGELTLSEAPGATGTPDIIVDFKDGSLFAVFELKYRPGPSRWKWLQRAGLLEKLAREGLEAIEGKEYDVPYLAHARQLVRIGLGVVGRGKCLALIGDGPPDPERTVVGLPRRPAKDG
jgi:hypothetical protein